VYAGPLYYSLTVSINIPFVNMDNPYPSKKHYSQFKSTIMKKIITLMFTTMLFTASFAQYNSGKDWDKGNNRDIVRNDDRNGNGYDRDDNKNFDHRDYYSKRERDMQIDRINREYDYKIQWVKNKFFMSRNQKERQICMLQDQRQAEIRRVMASFGGGWNHNDRDHDAKDRW
jgi:hypothetical protein